MTKITPISQKLLSILIILLPILSLTGCQQPNATTEELNTINDQITSYFTQNNPSDYPNYVFNYVDNDQKKVIVGLIDNSTSSQEEFKKTVVSSDLIKFVATSSNTNQDTTTTIPNNFTRTYEILYIENSTDGKNTYLTIKQFQVDDIQTVKVKKELCQNLLAGKNYEFTFKPNSPLHDNILSIFSSSEVISIVETNKVGLEQTQDSF